MHEKWNRAIKIFEDKGQKISPSDGDHVIVDGTPYPIGEVHEFAKRRYSEDWIESENAYLAALLGRPKTA